MRGGNVLVSGRDNVRMPSPGARLMNDKMLLTLQRMTKQIDELTSALEGDRERLPPTPVLLPPPTPSAEGGLELARRSARQLRGSINSFASHVRQLDARVGAPRYSLFLPPGKHNLPSGAQAQAEK